MLDKANAALVLVDVQGKLVELMCDKERLVANLKIMIRGSQILDIPILWSEQYPQGLGPTIPELVQLLAGETPLVKSSFSCCGNPHFLNRLNDLGRRQILLVGIETHVCIYQTACDLLDRNYELYLVTDATSSRTAENRRIGMERIKERGSVLTSTEMALFELLKVASGPQFKEISKLVK